MKSVATKRFWSCFADLPQRVRQQAKIAFDTWRNDPSHPSLHFKPVGLTRPIYSVRVGDRWRALGVRQGDTMVWYWIGSHADYDRLLTNA